MSKMRKDIQEELQKDEVAETFQRIGETFRANRNLLITMAIIIVAALLITYGLRSHRQTVARESNAMIADVIQRHDALISQPDAKQREDLLKQLVDAANTLADKYPDSPLGRAALYLKGNAYYQLDRFTEAEKAYTAYLDKAANNEEKARGEIALGYTFENASFLVTDAKDRPAKLEQALARYAEAARLAQGGDKANPAYPYLYYYAVICQARLNELTNKSAEATRLYEEVLKSRPEPVPADDAKETRTGEQDMIMQLVRRQLDEAAGQMSLQATAKTRLDRLKAAPLAAPPVMAEVKASATPAPAEAKPAVTETKPAAAPAEAVKPAVAPAVKPASTPAPTQAVKPVATATPTPAPTATPKPTATATPEAAKPAAAQPATTGAQPAAKP